ncbi:hypothetical protein [Amycolatopsis jiangsuensis]|uniref:Uncharacterized protein n=1 Tax=Amycolatopsis jiangsuensis TaxID=1181879 RepID=A0A840J639_9PSEU|nr:hypothetical protein [Amycolatopsis jiangsuensis]MBB4688902.1 hypothetical protein [Amycolatopsis jiangsuensis]
MIQARGRAIPVSAVVTLLIGVVLGFLVARFGGYLVRYPVETALVAVLIGSVLVLGWACREMLRDLVPFRRRAAGPEPEPPAAPRLSLARTPDGVRR